jgi:hypothetical protein
MSTALSEFIEFLEGLGVVVSEEDKVRFLLKEKHQIAMAIMDTYPPDISDDMYHCLYKSAEHYYKHKYK